MSFSSFIYQTSVRLYETDAAKVIFFGKLSEICHRTFEEFFFQQDFSLEEIISDSKIPYIFSVRHYECDFLKKMSFGSKLFVAMSCIKIGNSSFTINFDFYGEKEQQNLLANGKITYVCADKKTGEKISVPIDLKKIFSQIGKSS